MLSKYHQRKNCIKEIVITLFILLTIPLYSQNITVRPIPSLDKLPVNAIHRIFQDSDGYMWYGTFNGLCRYDGYNIRVFRSDLFHPGLLADNYITYIVEDTEKNIWFGTMKGAYVLDKSTYQIRRVDLQESSSKNVFTIHVTNDGTIWISVSGALFRFKSDGTLIKRYKIEYNNTPEFVYIVYEDKDENLLISITKGGMYKLNKEIDTFEPYFYNSEYRDIERIIWDETNGYYWLGTWGKGIVRFNPKSTSSDSVYVSQPLPVDINGESIGDIYHMVQDDVFHYIWVTTFKDLFVFRINPLGKLEQVDTSSFLTSGNKMLYEICKDKEGKLWVSAFDSESFIIEIRDYLEQKYAFKGLRNRISANPAINSFCLEGDSIMWLSQERYGLCLYNLLNDEVTHYSEFLETRNLPFWEISSFAYSQALGKVWALPHGTAVYQLYRKGMQMKVGKKIALSQFISNPGSVTRLLEDSNHKLWIGTTKELVVYNLKTHSFELVFEDLGYVSGIARTMDGQVWVSIKGKGIGQANVGDSIRIIPINKDIVCLDATSDGRLWMGTDEGEVLMCDPVLNKVEDHSYICGMKGDVIQNITVDTYNHIWITTSQLLKEYNPGNSAYRIYNTRSRSFLPDRFLSNSVYYDGRGDIFLGGISGVVSIPPSQQLESIPQQVKTHITDLKVMGNSIWDTELKENPFQNAVNISSTDHNLEVEFSSLDYHYLDQIRYAYRMVGLDNDWIFLEDGKNSAFYNKLDKGRYVFQVKATDRNGLWSNNITEFVINRLPAWYETWWAYAFYALIIFSLIGGILMIYLKRVKHGYKEEMDRQIELKISELEGQPSPDEQFLMKAIEIVELYLSDPTFDIVKLSEEMHVSRSTLTRRIKSITQKTPLSFIKDIKMKHALRLLENPQTPIYEVVTALGYNDHKHFTASFKEVYGITPSEYQRKLNK